MNTKENIAMQTEPAAPTKPTKGLWFLAVRPVDRAHPQIHTIRVPLRAKYGSRPEDDELFPDHAEETAPDGSRIARRSYPSIELPLFHRAIYISEQQKLCLSDEQSWGARALEAWSDHIEAVKSYLRKFGFRVSRDGKRTEHPLRLGGDGGAGSNRFHVPAPDAITAYATIACVLPWASVSHEMRQSWNAPTVHEQDLAEQAAAAKEARPEERD